MSHNICDAELRFFLIMKKKDGHGQITVTHRFLVHINLNYFSALINSRIFVFFVEMIVYKKINICGLLSRCELTVKTTKKNRLVYQLKMMYYYCL